LDRRWLSRLRLAGKVCCQREWLLKGTPIQTEKMSK